MRPFVRFALVGLVALFALGEPATAQRRASLGAGVVFPTGAFGDVVERGLTLRGQMGGSLALLDLHLQGGWSRFDTEVGDGEANLYHAGIGARVPLGVIWVGAIGAYFFGDGDEGLGVLPEVGMGLGPFEVVADYRIDGDENWGALRAAFRF